MAAEVIAAKTGLLDLPVPLIEKVLAHTDPLTVLVAAHVSESIAIASCSQKLWKAVYF